MSSPSPEDDSVPADTRPEIVPLPLQEQTEDIEETMGTGKEPGESVLVEASPLDAVTSEEPKKARAKTTIPLDPMVVPDLVLPQLQKAQPAPRRLVSTLLLLLLLLAIAAPLVLVAGEGIRAYTTYTALRTHASNGVHHLLSLKDIFANVKEQPASALDNAKLTQAKQQMNAARADFIEMQSLIDHSQLLQTVTRYLPQYRSQVITARAASQIGVDVSNTGLSLVAAMIVLAPSLRGPLLANTTSTTSTQSLQPQLITQNDLTIIGNTLDAILPYLDDIQLQSRDLSLQSLPSSLISEHQQTQVSQALQLLPQVEAGLTQVRALLTPMGWLLGVNAPRTFLVQTMDRAELRPTGGFTGQYGELQINGGRVAPFSLRDISLIEYASNSPTTDQLAPNAYRSWWPFANWGLRDSNLSADFPTSAQIAIQQYKQEVNRKVDGVIVFTPFLIEHMLQILGPIQLPEYHDTITAQNLENRLHYYQLDNAGIAKQLQVQAGDKSTSDRKRFTALVARTLLDRVRHATPSELLAIVRELPHDLQTRDLQMYFSNQQLEDALTQYGFAGQLDRATTHDGLYVVQANVSANKASQYVRTSMHDTVTLNAQGGATHVMQLRLAYTQVGPVYGLDTYRDYVRIYVPPSAHLLWGTGFDTGQPLCGGPLVACDANGVYPGQELVCPQSGYLAGASAPMLGDPYTGAWHPLDSIGGPTNVSSDEPQRAMFAGYIVVPKNCTMTATVSWYVPPINQTSQHSYQLLIQRQAGTFPSVDLTVLPMLPDTSTCTQLSTAGMHFAGVLEQDTTFTLKPTSVGSAKACSTPQPPV